MLQRKTKTQDGRQDTMVADANEHLTKGVLHRAPAEREEAAKRRHFCWYSSYVVPMMMSLV